MGTKKRRYTLALVLLLIVGAIVAIDRVVPATSQRRPAAPASRQEPLAPELQGISGWINSEPLTLKELRGQVVLIDFWTYTCVNCVRTFPYLKEWRQEYATQGLVIIGVHTPEFAFEKERANVETAVAQHALPYAVAMDNDYGTWDAFGNRYWPAKYLIDKDGRIRYSHFGEGSYDEVERWIRALLAERGTVAPRSAPSADLPDYSAFSHPDQTRELYAGYERNYAFGGQYIANEEYYQRQDEAQEYLDPGDHASGQMALHGLWLNGPQSVVHGRTTPDFADYIAIKFQARTVHAVLGGGSGTGYAVWVTLDGANLTPANAGPDVTWDEQGRSVLRVRAPRMHSLVELKEFGAHELRLSSTSDQFALFAFTFGSYPQGP